MMIEKQSELDRIFDMSRHLEDFPETYAEFQAWKQTPQGKDCCEHERSKKMSREQIIAEIIADLETLGLIPPESGDVS